MKELTRQRQRNWKINEKVREQDFLYHFLKMNELCLQVQIDHSHGYY